MKPQSALHGSDYVNHLNSGLMVVSCVVAYLYPFELFLFSYAVLGPLHYFTEISWLHQRGYFTAPPGPPKGLPAGGAPAAASKVAPDAHRGWAGEDIGQARSESRLKPR